MRRGSTDKWTKDGPPIELPRSRRSIAILNADPGEPEGAGVTPRDRDKKPKHVDNNSKDDSAAQSKYDPALKWNDVRVMTVLWAVEIVHTAVYYLKEGFIKDIFTPTEDVMIDRGRGGGITWTIITVSLMLSIGALLTFPLPKMTVVQNFMHKYMFWILLAGLSVYSSSAFIGLILSVTRSNVVAVLLSYLEISWYAVHPIRYWYIFHQRFPISVRWSHLIVSVNISAIWVTEFIVAGLVKNAMHPFSRTFYAIVFAYVTEVAIGWMAGIYFIKRLLNPAPGDLSSVTEVYAQTEVMESFERRQHFISIILFLALISPAVIFPVMNAYIEVGCIKLMENALSPTMEKMSYYRPDLLTALLVLMIVEGVLQGLKNFRNELCDVVIIVAAHLINIIAIISIMYLLKITYGIRNSSPEKDEAILMVMSDYDDQIFLQVGHGISKWHTGTSRLIINNIPDNHLVPIRLVKPETGKVIFEENVHIEVSRNLSVNAYNLLKDKNGYRLVQIQSFPPLQYMSAKIARVVITNGLEECTDYNKTVYDKLGFNENTTRGLRVDAICWPISLVFYREGSNSSEAVPFKPPPINEALYFEFVCDPKSQHESNTFGVCRYPQMILLRRNIDEYRVEINLPFDVVDRDYLTDLWQYSMRVLRFEKRRPWEAPYVNLFDCLDYRQQPEHKLVVTMALYGVSLGLAWVAYIHFIWIQCSVRYRMFIIFSFFTLIFTASSLTRTYLIKFNENSVFGLLIFATCCFLLQLVATVLYVIRKILQRKGKQQQPQQGWLRF